MLVILIFVHLKHAPWTFSKCAVALILEVHLVFKVKHEGVIGGWEPLRWLTEGALDGVPEVLKVLSTEFWKR